MQTPLPRPLDAWRAVVVAHDTLMRDFTPTIRSHGLTVAQYDVLLRLLGAEEHTVAMGELARTLLASSGAATKVVDRLVTLGLVTRERSEADARVVMVTTTAHGLEVALAAARAHAADVQARVPAFASPDEAAHVMAFLNRMVAADS